MLKCQLWAKWEIDDLLKLVNFLVSLMNLNFMKAKRQMSDIVIHFLDLKRNILSLLKPRAISKNDLYYFKFILSQVKLGR